MIGFLIWLMMTVIFISVITWLIWLSEEDLDVELLFYVVLLSAVPGLNLITLAVAFNEAFDKVKSRVVLRGRHK